MTDINEEILQAILANETIAGAVWRHPLFNERTPASRRAIARDFGWKDNVSTAIAYETWGDAVLDPTSVRRTTVARLGKNFGKRLLKKGDLSPEATAVLAERVRILSVYEEKFSSRTGIQRETGVTELAGVQDGPGVYAYTYTSCPHLIKVGVSGTKAIARVFEQTRKTDQPGDVVVLRFYPTEAARAFLIERAVHETLARKGFHLKSASGGVEWFATDIEEVDVAAAKVGVLPIYSHEEAS